MFSKHIYGASPAANSIGPYHYIYRITNVVEQKHYYGIRTSKNKLPKEDLGNRYFSSSYDKNFINDQKEHPENYKYKIIIITENRKQVSDLEIFLHNKFNVSENPKFYNLAIHTDSGFNTFGTVTVKDSQNNIRQVPTNDPDYIAGILVPIATGNTGNVAVRDILTNVCFKVSVDDPRYTSKQLIPTGSGCWNPRFKYYRQTPWGIFDSPTTLEPEISKTTLYAWCGKRNNDRLSKRAYTCCQKLQETFGPECIGKPFKELGFSNLTPEEYKQLQNNI